VYLGFRRAGATVYRGKGGDDDAGQMTDWGLVDKVLALFERVTGIVLDWQ
jgi:hypothetical protein